MLALLAMEAPDPKTFNSTLPLPFALTALLTVRSPKTTSITMLPLPPPVLTPALAMINSLVSCTKILPLVEFVAASVPIAVSMSLGPEAPMPVAATSVTVPDVVIFGSSVTAAVMSEIEPAVAVMLIALLVVVISPSFTLVAAKRSTCPLPVEYTVPSAIVMSLACAVTLMVPVPVVVKSPAASWVTPVAPVSLICPPPASTACCTVKRPAVVEISEVPPVAVTPTTGESAAVPYVPAASLIRELSITEVMFNALLFLIDTPPLLWPLAAKFVTLVTRGDPLPTPTFAVAMKFFAEMRPVVPLSLP